jgi:hypothetical protein
MGTDISRWPRAWDTVAPCTPDSVSPGCLGGRVRRECQHVAGLSTIALVKPGQVRYSRGPWRTAAPACRLLAARG